MEHRSGTLLRTASLYLRKLGNLLHRTASWINPDSLPQLENVPLSRWREDNGDRTHRRYYRDLSEHSLVFDLGGYEGQWASDIYSMYRCKILVFEPVEEFARQIADRFRRNPDVLVHHFGLADRDRTAPIALDKDGSSLFGVGRPSVDGRFVEANRFLREHAIEFVDLMKINIEGGEFDLLEHLLNTDWVRRICNIQVQFHAFVPDAEIRMAAIQERLAMTHVPTFQYHFVWENWRLKNLPTPAFQEGFS